MCLCNLEIEREREMEYLHSASYLKIRMIQERRLFILFLFLYYELLKFENMYSSIGDVFVKYIWISWDIQEYVD